jgi:8-hydroxy-5-deazaflavin:NADPH oxidoreductase
VYRHDAVRPNRRSFLQIAAAAAAGLAAGALPHALHAQSSASKSLKIGVIGSGRIGGTVGELWVKAGHEVMFSSLDLERDKALAARVRGGARAGTPKEAAAFGEVLFVSVPYSALPLRE